MLAAGGYKSTESHAGGQEERKEHRGLPQEKGEPLSHDGQGEEKERRSPQKDVPQKTAPQYLPGFVARWF